MKVFAFVVLAAAFIIEASGDISWSDKHSSGTFSPSYEARKAHDQAKYYARKAHDLAKLQSKIYGIGHGLYGYRYGSHFPHVSKPFPLLPFVDKYPLFDLGSNPYPFSHFFPHKFKPSLLSDISSSLSGIPDSLSDISSPLSGISDSLSGLSGHSPLSGVSGPLSYISSPLAGSYGPQSYHKPYFTSGISGYLTGFGYPKSHRNSYSKSYSYGSGYSYGNKNSYGINKPYAYSYSSHKSPPPLHTGYVKSIPGKTIVFESDDEPHSHGYEYAYVKESPENSKVGSQNVGGFNSIYGIRVNSPGYGQGPKGLPKHILAYEPQEPDHSGHYQLEPEGKVLISSEHGGHSYIPVDISGYDVDEHLIPDVDSYSSAQHSLPLHSDLVAYGSEKSQVREAKKA